MDEVRSFVAECEMCGKNTDVSEYTTQHAPSLKRITKELAAALGESPKSSKIKRIALQKLEKEKQIEAESKMWLCPSCAYHLEIGEKICPQCRKNYCPAEKRVCWSCNIKT